MFCLDYFGVKDYFGREFNILYLFLLKVIRDIFEIKRK